MDAVVGMEGDGPSGGDPRQIGCIIASADLTALDAVACRMIGVSRLLTQYSVHQPKEATGI